MKEESQRHIPFCVYFNKSAKQVLNGLDCQELGWTLIETKKLHRRKKSTAFAWMQYRWKMLIICGIFKFGWKAEQK